MHLTYEYYRDDWNERRKRSLLLGALRRPRYRRAFEPGCGFGNLTNALAQRCDALLASDHDALGVARARELLAPHHNVQLCTMHVPQEWPQGRFDLIVLGELLYRLSRAEIRQVAQCALQSLDVHGEVVACHWRHAAPATGISGDELHAELHGALPLQLALRHQEPDFILETWSRDDAATLAPAA